MSVFVNRGGALAMLALAALLGGCADGGFDMSGYFSKPLDLFGSKGGYTYSNLDDVKRDRPITANDLVDANGACPRFVAPAPAAPGPDGAPGAPDAGLLGSGIAIGMSECEVVAHLGQPTAINIGRSPNGDRSTTLTFTAGPRPGAYHFAGGRLSEMDRVELPPPQPAAKKKATANKKPAKPPPASATNGT